MTLPKIRCLSKIYKAVGDKGGSVHHSSNANPETGEMIIRDKVGMYEGTRETLLH